MRFDLKTGPSVEGDTWGYRAPEPPLVELRRAGYAVLPADGKTPLVSGFDKLRHSPSIATTTQWAAAHPSATAAMFLPRLTGRQGVIIIDVDDRRDLPLCQALFGSTPYMVHSSRGAHLGYAVRAVNEPLPFDKNILKRLGINADVKGGAGSDLVVAPGSLHASGLHTYTLEGGVDLDVVNEVPPLRHEVMQVLQALAETGMKIVREVDSGHSAGTSGTSFKQSSAYWPGGVADLPAHRGAIDNTRPAPPEGFGDGLLGATGGAGPLGRAGAGGGARPVGDDGRTRWHLGLFRDGSRELGLNDKLCSEAAYCDTFDELLDRAADLNADLARLGYEPLDLAVVERVVRAVWRDAEAGLIVARLGKSATPTIRAAEAAKREVS